MAEERILFMSSGANIDKTYPVTAEYFKPTQVYVMVEKAIYEDNSHDSAFLGEEKPRIQHAIGNVKTQVIQYPGREFNLLKIPELNQEEIQTAVMKIRNKYRNAKFCFNVTAGTALFTATLLLMGIWLDGEICITRTNEPLITIKVPRLSLNDLEQDGDLQKIIMCIGDRRISNKELAKALGYIRTERERIANKDKVTLSRQMDKLRDEWELVTTEKEGRENFYMLTDTGKVACGLFRKQ